jgi:hypothetical protein
MRFEQNPRLGIISFEETVPGLNHAITQLRFRSTDDKNGFFCRFIGDELAKTQPDG